MELRDIEIFLTLATELHFGRTAERLHVSAARVSQAIKKQERLIGAELFDRDSRKVRLTPAGERLRDDLTPVYRDLQDSMERARLASRGKTDVLRIGLLASNAQDLRPVTDEFTARHPTYEPQFRTIGFGDPFGPLRDGRVHVAILWLPVLEPDLTVGPVVYTETTVLAMSANHRLAGRESVSLEDLGDEVVMGGCKPDYWREALVPLRTPSGRLIRIGPIVTNTEEMLPILSTGEAVTPGHYRATLYYTRPDIAYVPIHDAPPLHMTLIWSTSAENEVIRAFADVVRDLGPLPLNR
ncbi:LysR family transcriptional regulator [Nonomuraea sp. NPDC059194]|uniref:LysR family transcriptional regulator n=1 Tax=Nonomuraea sp. NPDC059194 TaxID=3346764 RepID=UPI00368485F4